MQSPQNISNCEYLGKGIYSYISKEHRFGYDALLLANFASPKKNWNVIDLGCGCGIIPLIFARDFSIQNITGVDISAEAIDLLKLSAKKNGLDITAIHADLRKLNGKTSQGIFDLVTCNPPYFEVGRGRLQKNISAQTARSELECTIDDVAVCANQLLKRGGSLALCHRPQRLADVFGAMQKANIEPKRLRLIQQNINSDPYLILIEGEKYGGVGLKIEKPLIINNIDGKYTDEAKFIFEVNE
jgi:tRNA1Val (adenine37-N6)-methyltransferase